MKIIKLTGKVEVMSGLHIGGGDDTMKIGGVDNQVIKDVNTGEPYIPGSSLKGKMRSLLEWEMGLVGFSEGKPFSPKFMKSPFPAEKIPSAVNLMKLFGTSITQEDEKVLEEKNISIGITRISIGDCPLIKKEGQEISEAKYENVINRQTGTAEHPRQTERVPAGVMFDFDIRIKVFDEEEEKAMKELVERAMGLVENDYLGGSGSRGYGRVRFIDKKWE